MSAQTLFTVVTFHTVALLLLVSMFLVSRRPERLHYLLAAVLGIVTGFIDLHADDVQVTVLLLLVFGYFVGFARPRRAWQLGILLGMWVPLFAIMRVVALGESDRMMPEGLGSLLSLIPAFGGVYLGAAIRRITKHREAASPASIESETP